MNVSNDRLQIIEDFRRDTLDIMTRYCLYQNKALF